MRLRTRLLVSFVAVYVVLALGGGIATSWQIDRSLRQQAEDNVRSVLAEGGFSLSEPVLRRMESLTGYSFTVLGDRRPVRPGAIQIEQGGQVIEVGYLNEQYHRSSRAVLVATAASMLAGLVGFSLVAWWLARQFAGPVERLASAARTMGRGDLEVGVPQVGEAEVGALANDLEQMRIRLGELDRRNREAARLATLGLFTATIAHEVRNPLTAVRLTVQMLARRHGEDAGLILIGEELERLDLIIDELLAFSKGVTVVPEVVDLRPLADHIVRLLRRQAEHAGITLRVSGAGTVRADPARLRQMLLNLVLNGIQAQHGRPDGAVEIALARDGLAVIDAGPGVPTELTSRLFEPFASDKVGGTGLGLHLAHTIALAHGATLRYRRIGERTHFEVGGLPSA